MRGTLMNGKRIFQWVLLVGLGVASFTAAVRAAPPWENWGFFQKVEADPEKSYAVTESAGPWLIMACSFSGKGAEAQAQALVLELRKRYHLPAYVHRAKFDLKDVRGRGVNRYGAPPKMRYRHGNEIEEIAVLVGDFPSVDDARARKVLDKLKYATPQCLKIKTNAPTNQTLAGWRKIQQELQAKLGSQNKSKGPMGHAFITRNPLLPDEYFTQKGLDPLVLKMNKNVEHSLLDCPGKYTVRVATFKGEVLINQEEIRNVEQGKKSMKSGLDEAALKAHKLTEYLRMKGYEAYEFHNRYSSVVTVGSFDSVGTPLPDGRIDLHPMIVRIMRTFGSVQEPGKTGPQTEWQSLMGIRFDIQPWPIEVPKRSISAEISRAQSAR
jgi:hypothetical protein